MLSLIVRELRQPSPQVLVLKVSRPLVTPGGVVEQGLRIIDGLEWTVYNYLSMAGVTL